MKRVVVLISGSGSNLQAIIDSSKRDEFMEIVAVFSNVEDAFGLTRAKNAGIETVYLDNTHFSSREEYDDALSIKVREFNPDLVVLAGFMRILTPVFIGRFKGKILNIHPSLLPKFKGLHTHQRAIDAGETKHGCTVHFVTVELDGGPIIAQSEVPVLSDDTSNILANRVLIKEHFLFPTVIRMVLDGVFWLENNRIMIGDRDHNDIFVEPMVYHWNLMT